MTSKSILICTVGGSHQPIVTACRDLNPGFVCFVCSGKDPGTGKPGSDTQILGKGLCIKARHEDDKPTLPNIPAHVGLPENSFEVVIVPPDDLDTAVAIIRAALSSLTDRFPGHSLIADYTGGTKSMSAALVIEALEREDVELQLVTGNRANLVKVQDGTEASSPAIADAVRLNRAMSPYLAAWDRFAYDEAAAGLTRLRSPRNSQLRNQLNRARDLSRAFAAWDRFDHAEALRLLEGYAPKISRELGAHLGALKMLVVPAPQQEPMRLFDLWRNAERRAAQGRYDDAVARVYRLIEWSAQWLLRACCGIDTADIPLERIPPGMDIPPGRDGRRQAGLYTAWLLVERLAEGPAHDFAATRLPELLGHLQIRNESILAHGFSPIRMGEWEQIRSWMDSTFFPMLLAELARNREFRIHTLPPQLPSEYCWRE